MTRRDGLSSWRIIFFAAAGMLSGKSGANYVAKSYAKVKISYERTNSFSPGVFSGLSLMLKLGSCKTSARSIGYGKSLSGARVCMGGPVVGLTC